MMQKQFLIGGLNFLTSKTSSFKAANPNFKSSYSLVSFGFHNLYASKCESSLGNPNSQFSNNETQDDSPADVEDVSSAELKAQIDKFNKGDFDAIPTIFESILKRKLAGKHQDSDDELMNEFRVDHTSEVYDEDFDSSSNSDIDSDSDG